MDIDKKVQCPNLLGKHIKINPFSGGSQSPSTT